MTSVSVCHQTVGIYLRLFLGIVILWAGILKIRHPPDYFTMMQSITPFLAYPLAYASRFIVIIEVFLGAWLIIGLEVTMVSAALAVLLVIFTGLLFTLILRGYNGSCACFGAADQHQVGITHLIRNLLLLVLNSIVLKNSLDTICTSTLIWNISINALLISAFLVFVFLITYDLVINIEAVIRKTPSSQFSVLDRR